VHYPVLNRNGDVIASAITNLDLHDLGRLVCTYGVSTCYIVTPLKDQQALAGRLLNHWLEGIGKELHPDRERALRHLRVIESIAGAEREIEKRHGRKPLRWVTTAAERNGSLDLREAQERLKSGSRSCLILLGTGWGLAPSVVDEADAVLEPIRGVNGYNHLSVRCAAAILLDRLFCQGS